MISPVSSATAAPLRVLFSSAAPVGAVAPVARQPNSNNNQNSVTSTSQASEPAPGLTINPPALPATGIAAQEGSAEDSGVEGASGAAGDDQYTQEEQQQIAKLQARDREVRAHEQAHAAAGGAQAGAPSYSYEKGPDGRQYAVGGEVSISASSSSSDPATAIRELEQVVRAALAPAQPSSQDRAVAAGAQAQIAQLRVQGAKEGQAEAKEGLNPEGGESGSATGTESTGESESLLPELPGLPKSSGSGSGSDAGTGGPAVNGRIAAYQQAGAGNDSRKSGGLLSLFA